MDGFSIKKLGLVSFFVGLFLFLMPFENAFAISGCCSSHGGVTGCDSKTGIQMCKDGTAASKTCTCEKEKMENKGCCSGHGGVKQCDTKTGYQMCNDGTQSTSCACGKKS